MFRSSFILAIHLALLLGASEVVADLANTPKEMAWERSFCPAYLLSPLQDQLRVGIIAKRIDLDIRSLSQETFAQDVFQSHFDTDGVYVNEALEKRNFSYFAKLYRKEKGFDRLWLIGGYPHEVPRRALFDEIMKTGENWTAETFGISKPRETFDPRNWLRQEAQTPDPIALRAQNDRLKVSQTPKVVGKKETRLAMLEKRALCALYAPLRSGECARALERVVTKMSPRNVDTFGASVELARWDLFSEVVFDDTRYPVIAKKIARRMVGLVDSSSLPQTDLISLVRGVFREEVKEPHLADNMAWKFIGLYSVLGAEVGNNIRAWVPVANDLALSYHIFSSAIQVLDARFHGTGRLFSVPPQFTTHVDSGKPYHFLFSAFLARELRQEGFSETSAKVAPWLAQLGYQMLSSTKGRAPIRAFMVRRVDYPNLKIRFDLVNAAAGIRYGIESLHSDVPSFSASIDDVFKVSFKDSEESPLLQREQAEALLATPGISTYNAWTAIFQPKTIFKNMGLWSW